MADFALPVSEEERLTRRAEIAALEAHMKAMPTEELLSGPDHTEHYFASGVYVRQATIPAGVVVVGKIHKTEHIAILLKGRVRITTENGAVEYEAPQVMVSPPGTKRVAYAITETIWLAVHAVGEERDLDEIEERFIAADYDDPALSGRAPTMIDGEAA